MYDQLLELRGTLESHYRDVCTFEFVIQEGRLFVDGVRLAKRTHLAGVRFALQFFQEGRIALSEAVARVSPKGVEAFVRPEIANDGALVLLGIGLPASPGVATGKLVVSREKAEDLGRRREDFIFVRVEASPEDIEAICCSQGMLTSRGGMTSHATLVCRRLRKPCVAGFAGMEIRYGQGEVLVEGRRPLREDDWITLNGSTGKIYMGKGTPRGREWHQCPELRLLAQMIDYAIVSGELDLANVGSTWRIRDYFAHSRPLTSIPSAKRPARRNTYALLCPPEAEDVCRARDALCLVAPQQRENYSQILLGLGAAMSRLLAARIGLGNHHLYFRPLWDPETTCGPHTEAELAQFVGFEHFGINRSVPHLPDISSLAVLLELGLHSEEDRWFLDFTNPNGASLVANSDLLLGYRLFVNGVPVDHKDVPSLYNYLRRREYYWRWFEYRGTSHEEIVEFLESGKYVSLPESRMALCCEELGLLSHGKLTLVGASMIGKQQRGGQYDFFSP